MAAGPPPKDDRHTSGRRATRVVARVVAAALLWATPAAACSKASFHAIAAPSSAYLLARVGSDTVRTGAGSVRYRVAPGHVGAARDREIYGLVLDVERVAGPARAQLPARTRRVIVVPWDYGADCTPTPFESSVRWLEAGVRGVFSTILRPRSEWVNGVPVVDEFSAMGEPYAPGLRLPFRPRALPVETSLGLDEMMQLMDRLPTFEALRRDVVAATRPVYAWLRADTARARRFPANGVASSLKFEEMRLAMTSVRHPATGTYRMEVAVGARAPDTLFLRTSESPSSGGWRDPRPRSPDPLRPPPYDSYFFMVDISTTEASLLADCSGYRLGNQAYLELLPDPPMHMAGGTEFPVDVDTYLLLQVLARITAPDTALVSAAKRSFEPGYARFRQGEPRLMRGTIWMDQDGTARLTQRQDLDDGRRITMRGERISTTVVRCQL